MNKSITVRDSKYPFEHLIDDIKNNRAGTALFISNLSQEQSEALFTVLMANKHSLTQLTLLNCEYKGEKLSGLCNGQPFLGYSLKCGWGDKCTVRTLFSKEKNEDIKIEVNIGNAFETIKELWCSPLYQHVMNNDLTRVTELLVKGANPNIPSKYSKFKGTPFKDVYRFPLQIAVEQNQLEIVEVLLAYGADPSLGQFMTGNSLDLACEGSHAPMIQLLARAGCLIRCTIQRANIAILSPHLNALCFPLQMIKTGIMCDTLLTQAEFPNAATTIEQLKLMLITYDDAEKALLHKVCRFAYLRCENDDPMRKIYFNLMCFTNNEILSLKTMSEFVCIKLNKGAVFRNLPDAHTHEAITVYGEGFDLANLPADMLNEMLVHNEQLNDSSFHMM